MGRSKGTGVWGAVWEQIDYLKRASRYNAWGIKASQEDQTLKIKCLCELLDMLSQELRQHSTTRHNSTVVVVWCMHNKHLWSRQ